MPEAEIGKEILGFVIIKHNAKWKKKKGNKGTEILVKALQEH